MNPQGGMGSEMIPDYNLVAWSQDLNGNGELDFTAFGKHGPFGISSMVQIIIDETNRIFVCYTSITEGYHFYGEHYRRLWFRTSFDGGNTWGQFYHYIPDYPFQDMFDFMFPSCAYNTDENIHCIYLTGFEPGTYWFSGNETPENNMVWYAKIPKDEIVGIKQNYKSATDFEVSQNFPNPFSETTSINVNLQKPADINLEVINLFGQKVYETNLQNAKPGLNDFTIVKGVGSWSLFLYGRSW
ncbi:MAG: T9SS type A sorting domain-containing protein [Bacteroidales bacterium]